MNRPLYIPTSRSSTPKRRSSTPKRRSTKKKKLSPRKKIRHGNFVLEVLEDIIDFIKEIDKILGGALFKAGSFAIPIYGHRFINYSIDLYFKRIETNKAKKIMDDIIKKIQNGKCSKSDLTMLREQYIKYYNNTDIDYDPASSYNNQKFECDQAPSAPPVPPAPPATPAPSATPAHQRSESAPPLVSSRPTTPLGFIRPLVSPPPLADRNRNRRRSSTFETGEKGLYGSMKRTLFSSSPKSKIEKEVEDLPEKRLKKLRSEINMVIRALGPDGKINRDQLEHALPDAFSPRQTTPRQTNLQQLFGSKRYKRTSRNRKKSRSYKTRKHSRRNRRSRR